MTENERIRQLRKDYLNISLEKFGERVGVTRSAMSNIENGTRGVTEQMRKSICREYNVREEWLRDGDGDPFVKMDLEQEIRHLVDEIMTDEPESFRRRFVSMLARLTPDQWKTLSDVADMLAEPETGSPVAPAAAPLSDAQLHEELQHDIDLRKNPEGRLSGSGSTPA